MYFSRNLRRKFRRLQNSNWNSVQSAPIGPQRIAALMEAAKTFVKHGSKAHARYSTRFIRSSFATQKRTWIGNAGMGACSACGRGPRPRHWHHILPLASGGSNGCKNRIRICEECHAQIHLHMKATESTDDQLYRTARALLPKDPTPLKHVFDPTPRLIKTKSVA